MTTRAARQRLRKRLEEPLKPSFESTDKQATFTEAVFSGEYLYLAMGGGIRGTKTWGTLSVLILLCRIFPGSRWAVVRKDLPTLRRNTVPSINKMRLLVEGFVGELKQDTWTYTCSNGSEILLFPESFSTDPELDRWKGLEVNGFVLEEANELNEASANKAIERAGSWIIPRTHRNPDPQQPPPLVLFTFNPCDNWPRQWFYEPHQAGSLRAPYYYLPSTAADNPYITDAVREAWKNLPKPEYDRFIGGSWDFTADPDQLIPMAWIWAARDVEPKPGPHRLGIDPARFGDDETTFCRTRGNTFVDIQPFSKVDTNWTAQTGLKTAMLREFPVNAEDVRIDTVGLGGGVADNFYAEGWRITEVIAGGTAWHRTSGIDGTESFYTFKNVRTQMWWEAREKFRLGLISLPEQVPPKLVADLTSMKYKIHGDRSIEVWTKAKAKEKLGRSTDWADAFLMAILDPPQPSLVSFSSARM